MRRRFREEAHQPERIPRSVWILSWVSFFADVSSEMVYPLLPLFMISVLGTSKMQLGAMEGIAVLVVALLSAVAGIRSDRKGKLGGRVRWIRWGYGLPVLGKAIIALATAWPLVLSGRLLDRFGKGLRGAPRDALIADAVSPDLRGRAFGLHRTLDTAGAMIGVLLSALMLWWLTGTPQSNDSGEVQVASAETPAWVYRSLFGIGAGLGLASLLLTFWVQEPKSTLFESQVEPAASSDELGAEDSPIFNNGWLGLPNSYWHFIFILILFSLANSSDVFLLLRVRELGYTPWAVVTVYAFYNLLYACLSYPVGKLSDRIGRWYIIELGWILYACVYAALAFLPASQAWGVWPIMGIYGVYMALTDGVGKALIADHSPSNSRGKAMGVFYGLTGLSTLLASLSAGILWDRFGSASALLFGSACAALSIIASASMGRARRNSAHI
jgi:MFS family permease